MINRYFHYKADKAYRVFSYVIFQTEEHKNIQYTDNSYDYTVLVFTTDYYSIFYR